MTRPNGHARLRRAIDYRALWLAEDAALDQEGELEDRAPERKVFQDLHVSAARRAMFSGCNVAEIPHSSPHDLRHWRIILERAGHSKPSMSLDVYAHVMPVKRLQDPATSLPWCHTGVT